MDPTASNFDPEAGRNCCCQYPGPELTIEFHHMLNGVPFEFGKTTVNDLGIPFNLDEAQFYMSNITLQQGVSQYMFTDDSCTDNHFLFVEADKSTFVVGEFPAGNYTGISFTLGVDTVINKTVTPADPCLAEHPLQNTEMHWGALGYLHLRAQGGVDTSAVPDGIIDVPLFVHAGLNPLVRTVTIPYTFTGANKDHITLALDVEWVDLFKGIDLRADSQSQTVEDLPLATAVMDNAQQMFSKHPL
jgi:hypothetical protein